VSWTEANPLDLDTWPPDGAVVVIRGSRFRHGVGRAYHNVWIQGDDSVDVESSFLEIDGLTWGGGEETRSLTWEYWETIQ
jgi:hypothetical protein